MFIYHSLLIYIYLYTFIFFRQIYTKVRARDIFYGSFIPRSCDLTTTSTFLLLSNNYVPCITAK